MSRFDTARLLLIMIAWSGVTVLLTGCTTARVGGAPALDLAPQSDTHYHCGPSTLASVMAFHGATITEPQVAGAIYSASARGTLLTDMAWFAREHGFQASLHPGSLEELRAAVSNRTPPIVLLDLGLMEIRKPHITAVTGFTEDGVLQLGRRSAREYASRRSFERQWQRAGHMILLVTPR